VLHVDRLDRGHLVDDHIWLRLGHRGDHLIAVEGIDDRRRRPEVVELAALRFASRGPDDLVTGRDQPRHELLADHTCGSCNKDFHFGLLGQFGKVCP
jgi:hypothetical protein